MVLNPLDGLPVCIIMAENALRDTISALVDKSEAGEPLVETPTVTPVETTTPVETATEVEGRTAGRARDEKGRLLPGKAAEAVPAVPERKPIKVRDREIEWWNRPSTWKPDYEKDWGTLPDPIKQVIHTRESDFAHGVSTYKTEWENAKSLVDAVAPYLPDLQKAGVSPAQAVSRLASTHKALMDAQPQHKLQLFAKLAQDYQVPLQALYDPQFAQQFAMQQSQQPQESPDQAARRVYSELRAMEGVHEFGSRKDASGNPLYPHFEVVRPKMAQLLESGLAQDLEGAYHAAIKLDDELWKTEQEAKVKADEALRLETQRKAVLTAKTNAISPKSSTPASTGAGGKKGLRETISSVWDETVGGRV